PGGVGHHKGVGRDLRAKDLNTARVDIGAVAGNDLGQSGVRIIGGDGSVGREIVLSGDLITGLLIGLNRLLETEKATTTHVGAAVAILIGGLIRGASRSVVLG